MPMPRSSEKPSQPSVGRAYGQRTAAADQFLARLDQAIGLSNALARALSGAARVLDGVRRGPVLLLPSEQEADRRAQAEALRAQIARLEAESDGRDSLRSQPRRGSIRGGLLGAAQRQTGVYRAARPEELRRQRAHIIRSYSLPAGAAQDSTGRPKRWAKPRAARSAPGPANSPKCAQIGSDRSGSACTSSTHHSVSRCAKE